MRSSDIWLGIPYDVFTFTMLQNCLAGELGVKRGWFALNAGSSHLYDRDTDVARDAMNSVSGDSLFTNDLPGFPPSWLDSILVTRDRRFIPQAGNAADAPWLPFAEVLLCETRAQARDVLRTSQPTVLNGRLTV